MGLAAAAGAHGRGRLQLRVFIGKERPEAFHASLSLSREGPPRTAPALTAAATDGASTTPCEQPPPSAASRSSWRWRPSPQVSNQRAPPVANFRSIANFLSFAANGVNAEPVAATTGFKDDEVAK